MEAFGIMGMMFGTIGFVLAITALAKIGALEKKLGDLELLNKDL